MADASDRDVAVLTPADQLAAFEAKHPPGSLAPGPHSAICNLIWRQAATYFPEIDAFTFNPRRALPVINGDFDATS